MCFVSKRKYNELNEAFEDVNQFVADILLQVKLAHDHSPKSLYRSKHLKGLVDVITNYFGVNSLDQIDVTSKNNE